MRSKTSTVAPVPISAGPVRNPTYRFINCRESIGDRLCGIVIHPRAVDQINSASESIELLVPQREIWNGVSDVTRVIEWSLKYNLQ